MEYWNTLYAPIIVAFIISIGGFILNLWRRHNKDKKTHQQRVEQLLGTMWVDIKSVEHSLITVNNGSGEKYKAEIEQHKSELKPTLEKVWGLKYVD